MNADDRWSLIFAFPMSATCRACPGLPWITGDDGVTGGTPLPPVIPINKGLRSKHPMGYRRSIPDESRFFAVITICWDEHRYFRFDPNILGSLPPKKPNAADGNSRCG